MHDRSTSQNSHDGQLRNLNPFTAVSGLILLHLRVPPHCSELEPFPTQANILADSILLIGDFHPLYNVD